MRKLLAACVLMALAACSSLPADRGDPHSAATVLERHLALLELGTEEEFPEARHRQGPMPEMAPNRNPSRFLLLVDVASGTTELWERRVSDHRLLFVTRAVRLPRLPEGVESAVGRIGNIGGRRVTVRWESEGVVRWDGHLGDLSSYREALPTGGAVAYPSEHFISLRRVLQSLGAGRNMDVMFHQTARHWAQARSRQAELGREIRNAHLELSHPPREE